MKVDVDLTQNVGTQQPKKDASYASNSRFCSNTPGVVSSVNISQTYMNNRSGTSFPKTRMMQPRLFGMPSLKKSPNFPDGFILLRNFLKISEQQEITKMIFKYGKGNAEIGGFYVPQSKYGSKMKINYFCMGKHWNPSKCFYQDRRQDIDNKRTSEIPEYLKKIVARALVTARQDYQLLPSMVPDTAIVNHYKQDGRIGMHQDKDESQETLARGIPVISFSLGDSMDFSWQIKVPNSEEVTKQTERLNSGDVLVFGGPSKNLYHSVDNCRANTMPAALLPIFVASDLGLGRIAITFRQTK